MPSPRLARLSLRLVLLSAALSALSVWACSVPVFRYALEKWPADPYQAVVFHRGPLSEAQRAVAGNLGTNGLAGQLHANLSLRLVDLEQNPKPELLELWRQSGGGTLPWLAVRYPLAMRSPGTVWAGPLAETAIQPLLDSPVRKEITERLVEGQSAVWVLLESGDRARDDAAAALLEPRLAYLAATLKVPKLSEEDIAKKLVSVPESELRVEFSLLRLARGDPAEQPFIQMLLGLEADLKEAAEPIVFPVFGRGRVLYALVGKGIKHETIDQAAMFLIGRCSCEIKEKNPGGDLLLAADWDTLVKSQFIPDRDLPSLAALAKSGPVTVTISGGADAGAAPDTARRARPTLATMVAGGIAVAGLVLTGILWWRRRQTAS
ncbi:MAG: hypothetical protein HZA89_09000 [Verrucomicrobia bacterium]|nr:hypothetical protein [Verrucomicrobiota bacterium]